MRNLIATVLIALSFLTAGACRADPVAPKRVLFIGNSLAALNGGIDSALSAFLPGVYAERITPNGYYLENHFRDAKTLEKIRTGHWDIVVLQEQSQLPVYKSQRFFEFAEKLAAEIREAGAAPALFMTWERPDSAAAGVTYWNIANAYEVLGQRLGITVVPVGKAFEAAHTARPKLALYSNDGHPTAAGTYLAASVFAAALFGTTTPLTDVETLVKSPEERKFLSEIAGRFTAR